MAVKRAIFPGRFQPFHEGHASIVQSLLDEGLEVTIMIRDTELNAHNPYTFEQRRDQIYTKFPITNMLTVQVVDDFSEIVYGRDPGWSFREVEVPQDISRISGTTLRGGAIIWLSGQSGAGKTTLAYNLKENYLPSAVILDGDEMRLTISEMNSFSKDSRKDHNLRVARLAKLLRDQGHIVIVAVIAPYQDVRDEITRICAPMWVYLKRQSSKAMAEGWPYEFPEGGLTEYEWIIGNDEREATVEWTLEVTWGFIRASMI